jgi:hypothetical protein
MEMNVFWYFAAIAALFGTLGYLLYLDIRERRSDEDDLALHASALD